MMGFFFSKVAASGCNTSMVSSGLGCDVSTRRFLLGVENFIESNCHTLAPERTVQLGSLGMSAERLFLRQR